MASILSPVTSSPPPIDDDAARRRARARIYELIRAAQVDGELTSEMVAEILDEGERRGWSDVVKLGMFLGLIRARYVERMTAPEWIERLLERAQADGDDVMTAVGLAERSREFDVEGGRAPVDADRDLARAIVLLEGWTGSSQEAVTAHIDCAMACERRDLWELQLDHYDSAEACLDWDEGGADRLPVLLYNRAEVQVNWVAALRELGEVDGLDERAQRARTALEAADVPLMPESWRGDLVIFRQLVDAICPPDGQAPPYPAHPAEGEFRGFVHLARAFATAAEPEARTHVALALETIDQENFQRVYLLALTLAVELEAASLGTTTYGLRWGRELVARRWERRLATLASMQSLVEVERMAAEHAQLKQHAFLDDLTGLANRRGLSRFIEGLRGRGVRTAGVALVDLDRFKLINDGHGHAVGDQTLSRVAAILKSGVREQDLVVRLGGDEFLLLLTLHDHEAARRRCETIVETISAAGWGEVSPGLRVAASLGIAFGSLDEFDELCATADAALYRAKQAGGARVVS